VVIGRHPAEPLDLAYLRPLPAPATQRLRAPLGDDHIPPANRPDPFILREGEDNPLKPIRRWNRVIVDVRN
jgi:hypothetical protein